MAIISLGMPFPGLDLCGHAISRAAMIQIKSQSLPCSLGECDQEANSGPSVYETYRLLLPMSLTWEYLLSWGILSISIFYKKFNL